MFKKILEILKTIFLIFAICILIYVIYEVIMARQNDEEVFIFGYKPYIILTGSMEPELQVNELVIIKKTTYDKVKIGDIINFYAPGVDKTVCHRVIDINEAGMYTKGDNNSREDLLTITEDNLVGKMVFKTSAIAFILNQVSSPIGIIKLVCFITAILLAIILIKVIFKKSKSENENINSDTDSTQNNTLIEEGEDIEATKINEVDDQIEHEIIETEDNKN